VNNVSFLSVYHLRFVTECANASLLFAEAWGHIDQRLCHVFYLCCWLSSSGYVRLVTLALWYEFSANYCILHLSVSQWTVVSKICCLLRWKSCSTWAPCRRLLRFANRERFSEYCRVVAVKNKPRGAGRSTLSPPPPYCAPTYNVTAAVLQSWRVLASRTSRRHRRGAIVAVTGRRHSVAMLPRRPALQLYVAASDALSVCFSCCLLPFYFQLALLYRYVRTVLLPLKLFTPHSIQNRSFRRCSS